MITSIFSKSKPINFIVVFFIVLLAFLIARVQLVNEAITIGLVFKELGLLFVCLGSVLLLNFIVSKNSLTRFGNYEILLFSLFLLALPQSTGDANILLANFFVLLAIRRIISLRSQLHVRKKLFDTAFWIAIASLFYFWALLFFILIPITLLLYTDNKIKHWIIPFVGVVTVFVICVSISIVWNGSFFGIFVNLPEWSYDFKNYNTLKFLLFITTLFSFGLWSSLFYIKNLKQKKKAFRPSFTVVIIAAVIATAIIVLAPEKNGSEFLFLFAPSAVIITNYIETIEETWFKELFLAILFLVPFVLLFI
ncbi:DUF6427 family protein [Snuella sedimenti]|uniref:Beta-carotene 15,15'-monooxygenase n=1 Tax=Snuella sedimenti TaxID=2798802 RepID=A0A8J7LTC4_9FLAO|nr:DUF6427 family protein [Snuella sedimenti]MBJ6368181.1 hypothetical protein [Snuella sedimenti]